MLFIAVFEVYMERAGGVQPKQWHRFLKYWGDNQRPIYNLCWRIPTVLKKASPLHYRTLITCTQKNGLARITDKTHVELFFHRELYAHNAVTVACMDEIAQNLSALLNSGIPAHRHNLIVHPDYRIYAHPVINLQEDDDNSGANFTYFDKKFLSELQTDFETNWIPKLTALHPEHPLVVQLNTGKYGSRIKLTSDVVTFDVFYDETTQYNHTMFLTEIVASINRQASINPGNKSYVDYVKSKSPACMIFMTDT
ncbi:hypothetical protein PHET_10887 [Paragonimus heterotremus]|uniref:Uncharacterized protein n=1 Tax=Paragonimus heterotremus TaxID=100268 RepID=A0A8J4WMQ5_9TREM|nr:hypothetical protein PHET_10887 [Paragonimus heterotremus]